MKKIVKNIAKIACYSLWVICGISYIKLVNLVLS